MTASSWTESGRGFAVEQISGRHLRRIPRPTGGAATLSLPELNTRITGFDIVVVPGMLEAAVAAPFRAGGGKLIEGLENVAIAQTSEIAKEKHV